MGAGERLDVVDLHGHDVGVDDAAEHQGDRPTRVREQALLECQAAEVATQGGVERQRREKARRVDAVGGRRRDVEQGVEAGLPDAEREEEEDDGRVRKDRHGGTQQHAQHHPQAVVAQEVGVREAGRGMPIHPGGELGRFLQNVQRERGEEEPHGLA
jgi:hypothetical protein